MTSTEPRTVLLYCPYDKRVTRHARRGPRLQMFCVECGRGTEEDEEGSGGEVEAKTRRQAPVA